MSHTVGATTANNLWDVNRSVPEILQDGTNTYVYGLGLISSTDGSGVQTYYDADGLGSTADLTNSSPTKTDGYTYDAFGAPTHSPGGSTQPFQFTGQQTDADSGLQYLRARYYDPTTGRFLSQDPLAGLAQVPATQNRYPYALGDPTTLVDPRGLCSTPWGCASDAVSSVYDDPRKLTKGLDRLAFQLDASAAVITDTSAALGCTVGPEGCGAGYLAGYAFTRPLTVASVLVSGASSTITCADAAGAFGDKEGSSFTDCKVSVITTVYGTTPEPNISAAIAGYQVCYDAGRCQPEWNYGPWNWNWRRAHGW
jgi:RHS repeat-associated protein